MMELTVMSYPVEAIKGVNELSSFCSVHKINLLTCSWQQTVLCPSQ